MKLSGRTFSFPILLALVGASALRKHPRRPPLPVLFSAMRWREVGPMRAGRTRALAGVAGEPSTFYIGAVGGGVFKTTDAGETWHSLWDDQPTGSIGAIAVAPSDPNVIYVGSGEGLARPDLSTGDGVYKSTDAGKTWVHLGLRDSQQIGQVAVSPRILTLSSSRQRDIHTDRTKSVGCTSRRTAAPPSSGCSSSTTIPARRRCRSIRSTRTSSSPGCGRGRKGPGRMAHGRERTAGSSAPRMAARPLLS